MSSDLNEISGWVELHNFIDGAPMAILLVDRERMIRLANRRAMSLFGWARDALVGQSLDILLPPDKREAHAELFDAWFDYPVSREMGASVNIEGYSRRENLLPVQIELHPVELGREIYAAAWITPRPGRENR